MIFSFCIVGTTFFSFSFSLTKLNAPSLILLLERLSLLEVVFVFPPTPSNLIGSGVLCLGTNYFSPCAFLVNRVVVFLLAMVTFC